MDWLNATSVVALGITTATRNLPPAPGAAVPPHADASSATTTTRNNTLRVFIFSSSGKN
jgi:hypothetical protein